MFAIAFKRSELDYNHCFSYMEGLRNTRREERRGFIAKYPNDATDCLAKSFRTSTALPLCTFIWFLMDSGRVYMLAMHFQAARVHGLHDMRPVLTVVHVDGRGEHGQPPADPVVLYNVLFVRVALRPRPEADDGVEADDLQALPHPATVPRRDVLAVADRPVESRRLRR